jgi:hypothetical protein
MTPAETILSAIESQGVILTVCGDRLDVDGPTSVLTDELIDTLIANKSALINCLVTRRREPGAELLATKPTQPALETESDFAQLLNTLNADARDQLAERAAIIAEDGTENAEALAAGEWNRRQNFDYSIQAVTPTPTQSPLLVFFAPLDQMIEIPQDIPPADWKYPF